MYTKEQVLEFLGDQRSLQGAIENIDDINSGNPSIIDKNTNKALFYFDKSVLNTQDKLKTRIVKHMEDNAWETNGKGDYMSLRELMDYLELSIKKGVK